MKEEPKIFFLMGKIYKAMGDRSKALHNFTITQKLDPKMMHVVKTTIERLENDNEISMTTTSVMSDANLEGETSSAAAAAFVGDEEEHNQHHQEDQIVHGEEDRSSVYTYDAFVDE